MDLLAILLAALLGFVQQVVPGELRDGRPAPGAVEITLDEPSPGALPPLPRIEGPADQARPLVVIDPGHGGRDPGATAPFDDTVEKSVTLELARALRDRLIESGRVRVALTRDADRYLTLHERYEIARRLGARLFISLHADAAPLNDLARGATVYTLSEVASDREAALLAASENRSGLIGGAQLSEDEGVNRILIDLAQRESMNVSADFARLLHREGSALFPFRSEYHRFASLIVLKAPDMPSVLFESGYLTNREDYDYITSTEGQQQIATGIQRAIEAHFARRLVRIAGR